MQYSHLIAAEAAIAANLASFGAIGLWSEKSKLNVSKYLADSWKSSIKKVTEEKEGETTYRLKGDISGGTISIRTTGRSSLKVEIKYNLN